MSNFEIGTLASVSSVRQPHLQESTQIIPFCVHVI